MRDGVSLRGRGLHAPAAHVYHLESLLDLVKGFLLLFLDLHEQTQGPQHPLGRPPALLQQQVALPLQPHLDVPRVLDEPVEHALRLRHCGLLERLTRAGDLVADRAYLELGLPWRQLARLLEELNTQICRLVAMGACVCERPLSASILQ